MFCDHAECSLVRMIFQLILQSIFFFQTYALDVLQGQGAYRLPKSVDRTRLEVSHVLIFGVLFHFDFKGEWL